MSCPRFTLFGTLTAGATSNSGVDYEERQALRAEGLDPDDPAVIAAIDMVRWELDLLGHTRRASYRGIDNRMP